MTLSYLFFFQAEDGIRDYKVTGVQTCALPILYAPASPRAVSGLTAAGLPGRRCGVAPAGLLATATRSPAMPRVPPAARAKQRRANQARAFATAGGPPSAPRATPTAPDAAADRCGENRSSSRPPARSPPARRDAAGNAVGNPRARSRPG